MARKAYIMTQAELDSVHSASRPVAYMVIGGMEPNTPQENANRVWRTLGKKYGFKWDTAKPAPAGGDRAFTAEEDDNVTT